jgi:drug/metabolite transporter (DMT)-like permease
MPHTGLSPYLKLHIAVLLFGFTAILGKLIDLPELYLVWYRMGLTTLSFLAMPRLRREVARWKPREVLRFMGIGWVVASHWVAFFGSVKYGNVSVTLTCMATASFFTSLIEPLVVGSRFRRLDLAMGLLVVPGVYLMFEFTREADFTLGIAWGLLAAMLAGLFGSLNKRYIGSRDATAVSFLELGSGWLFLSLIAPFYAQQSSASFLPVDGLDWLWLLVLALLCTTLAYVYTMEALRKLSAFLVSLTINLEPVYGIAMAFVLFDENERLPPGFFLGTLVILAAVFLHPLLSRRFQPNKA